MWRTKFSGKRESFYYISERKLFIQIEDLFSQLDKQFGAEEALKIVKDIATPDQF
jgi:hypothetical protein